MKNRIPPPILLLFAGAIMWFVAKTSFAFTIRIPFANVISVILVVTGLAIAIIATRQFSAAKTTVNPLSPSNATALVSAGIFSFSRNPMYVGMLLILMAWAVWLASLTNVLAIILWVQTITYLQIKPEEEALSQLFGEQYLEYCQRVRRWF